MKLHTADENLEGLELSGKCFGRSSVDGSSLVAKGLLQKIDQLNDKIFNMEKELADINTTGFSLQRDMVKHLVSSIDDALIVISPDSIIESITPAATKLTGYSQEELVGQSLDRLFPNESNFNDLVLPIMKQKLQRLHDEDANEFWRIVKSAPFGILLVTQEGKIRFANDISTKMFDYQNDELLNQPIHELVPSTIAASHPKMMAAYFANPEPRFIESKRNIQGLNRHGKTISLSVGLVPLVIDEQPHVLCICQNDAINQKWPANKFSEFGRLINNDNFWNIDGVLNTKHNAKIDVSISGALLHNQDSRTNQGILIIKDISAQKIATRKNLALEAQLESAQKLEMLGTMAGGIAHDFNNLLTPIIGYTELLLANAPDPEPLREDIGSILKAANRARDLVFQLLLCEDKSKTDLAPINIDEIVAEVLSFIRSSTPDLINIETHILSENNLILADPVKIYQIIMNLCTNACQAMDSGGTLSITVSSRKKSIKLMVTDTGKGISDEIKTKIFDPFFTTRTLGTGLGLAVTHGIIKHYNGDITVRSRVNKGTSFIITLPKAEIKQV